jgi:ABC-type uncharacterized transport system ATPase subunit
VELSDRYGLMVDPDAMVEDITVGMQQRTEILKMLYRDNEVLIFDEPTAVLTPQEIDELMKIMKGLAAEGKSILFITHKLDEIMQVADRCSVLRKGKYIGTVNVADTTKEALSEMMVGRKVQLVMDQPLPEGLQVVHHSAVGRVQTVIVRGNAEAVQAQLQPLNPLLCDVLPLSLEEVFIYELGGVDYEVKNVLL